MLVVYVKEIQDHVVHTIINVNKIPDTIYQEQT